MRAVVMAGGFGTRLRPLSCNLPKPMVPMANRPMLEHILQLLKKHNITEITMMLYYQPEVISNYFGNGQNWGVKIEYEKPDSDLGTAGCVGFLRDKLNETFLVISGDVLTDFDLSRAIKFHQEKSALATIVMTRVKNPLAYGIIITNASGKIERFLEKPSWGEVFTDTINTGIYILDNRVLELIPPDRSYDFSKNLYPDILKKDLGLYGYIAEGYWKDVGNLEEYRLAHYDVLEEKVKINLEGKIVKIADREIVCGENSRLDSSVKIVSKIIIGKNCLIGKEVELGNSVIGDNVVIQDGASVVGSVIWNNTRIGAGARIKESVIGNNCNIGNKAVIQVGTVISDDCSIGKEAIIRANVKIWPHKVIEDGATLSTSLVWGEKWTKALFGAYGISGLANIEITPEFATKVGAAYGAYLGKGKYVITSRDAHKASRMIKRTMISGLLSAGVKVGDLRTTPIPVVRYEQGKEGEAGAIHVRISPRDPRMIDIKIFNEEGGDISVNQEKAIEQLFLREDFQRAALNEIGEITVPPRANEYYKTGYLKSINRQVLGKTNFKVVIDYAYSSAALIFPTIMGELGLNNVVALNAYINPNKISRTPTEINESLEQLADIVTTLKADIGFLIDIGAERVSLVDEKGLIIPDEQALLLVALLVMHSYPKKSTIAVPVNVTGVIDELARRHDFPIKRIPLSSRQILAAARQISAKEKIVFLGDGQGGFIFPEFQPAFDAMYAIGKILEMMAAQGSHLSRLNREVPAFSVLHELAPCPWDKKGQVMHRIIESSAGKKTEMIDGIKIFIDDSWVLLLPDEDEAYFHIWVESSDEDNARNILKKYSQQIAEWQK